MLSVGALECWVQTSETDLKFEKVWSKTYPSQAICLHWDSISQNLFVGLDDGKLNTLRIPPDVNFIRYEEMLDEKIHEGRVMGVHYDSISGITYTCSEDKSIKVVERGKVIQVL